MTKPVYRQPVATRRALNNRKPIAVLVERQRERVTDLDARIGRLMTARADAEEVLADLLDIENGNHGVLNARSTK